MTEVHEQNAKELADIRRRISALEKELSALKSGAWAGAIRYQQIMDGEPENRRQDAPPPEKISNRER
jgi:hypothetical protein